MSGKAGAAQQTAALVARDSPGSSPPSRETADPKQSKRLLQAWRKILRLHALIHQLPAPVVEGLSATQLMALASSLDPQAKLPSSVEQAQEMVKGQQQQMQQKDPVSDAGAAAAAPTGAAPAATTAPNQSGQSAGFTDAQLHSLVQALGPIFVEASKQGAREGALTAAKEMHTALRDNLVDAIVVAIGKSNLARAFSDGDAEDPQEEDGQMDFEDGQVEEAEAEAEAEAGPSGQLPSLVRNQQLIAAIGVAVGRLDKAQLDLTTMSQNEVRPILLNFLKAALQQQRLPTTLSVYDHNLVDSTLESLVVERGLGSAIPAEQPAKVGVPEVGTGASPASERAVGTGLCVGVGSTDAPHTPLPQPVAGQVQPVGAGAVLGSIPPNPPHTGTAVAGTINHGLPSGAGAVLGAVPPNPPPVGSDHGVGVRAPTGRLDAKSAAPLKFNGNTTTNIPSVRTWFELYVRYMLLMALDAVSSLPFYLTGKAQLWVMSYFNKWENEHGKNTYPPLERLRTDFLQQFDTPRKHTPIEARWRLQKGELNQGVGERVADYVARFRMLLQDAGDMSMIDRIVWFLKGMQSRLREQCSVRPDGTDWTNLEDLITYSLGMEQRSDAGKDATSDDLHVNFARSSPPSRKKKALGVAGGGVNKPRGTGRGNGPGYGAGRGRTGGAGAGAAAGAGAGAGAAHGGDGGGSGGNGGRGRGRGHYGRFGGGQRGRGGHAAAAETHE
jgi:hypothetical protein